MATKANKAEGKAVTYRGAFDVLKHWPREAGPVVTEAQLQAAAALVKRPGTGKHLGAAMALRDGGCTQAQVVLATGDTQLNVLRDAVTAKLARAMPMPVNGAGHKVYRIELTAKAGGKPRAARQPKAKPEAEVTAPQADGEVTQA
jgi:hypothetical protein